MFPLLTSDSSNTPASPPPWRQFLLGSLEALWVLAQTLIIAFILMGLRLTFNFWPANEMLTSILGYLGSGIYLVLIYRRYVRQAPKAFLAYQCYFAGTYLVNLLGTVLLAFDAFHLYGDAPYATRVADLLFGLLCLVILAVAAFIAYTRTNRKVPLHSVD